jgi:hypothetical protein
MKSSQLAAVVLIAGGFATGYLGGADITPALAQTLDKPTAPTTKFVKDLVIGSAAADIVCGEAPQFKLQVINGTAQAYSGTVSVMWGEGRSVKTYTMPVEVAAQTSKVVNVRGTDPHVCGTSPFAGYVTLQGRESTRWDLKLRKISINFDLPSIQVPG